MVEIGFVLVPSSSATRTRQWAMSPMETILFFHLMSHISFASLKDRLVCGRVTVVSVELSSPRAANLGDRLTIS